MKKSIKISLVAFFAVLLSTAVFAQRGHGDKNPEQRAEKITKHMTESLNLSEAQTAKVKAIHLKYGERMKAMRSQQTEDDRSKKRAAMEKVRADRDAEIKTVLTEEQYQKFQESPRRGPRGGHKGFRKGHDRKHKGARKAAKNEEINAILVKQRAKLETKITVEDKATIAQLRTAIKKDKAAAKAKRKEMKEERQKGERPSREERKKRKAEFKNNPNHVKLMELTEKYSADIKPLLEEVKPEIKALKEAAKAERKGEKEENFKGKKDRKDRGHRKGRKGWKGKKEMTEEEKVARKEKGKLKKQAHFLLLDPNETVTQKALSPANTLTAVKVYPNPSRGISQIEYELKEAGSVLIELRDKEGSLLDTIERSEKSAGKHKTSVNFGKYTVGIYYIVLTDKNGATISEKVIR